MRGTLKRFAQGWWCGDERCVDARKLGIGPFHYASGEEDEDEGDAARDAKGRAEAEFGNEEAECGCPGYAADTGASEDDAHSEAAAGGEPGWSYGYGGHVDEAGTAAEEEALRELELPEVLKRMRRGCVRLRRSGRLC